MLLSIPYPKAKLIYTVSVAVPRAGGGIVDKHVRYTPFRDRADQIFLAYATGTDVPRDTAAPRLTGRYDEVYTHWHEAVAANVAVLAAARARDVRTADATTTSRSPRRASTS